MIIEDPLSIIDAADFMYNMVEPFSEKKLQLLCYYSQVWSMIWDGAPLFPEDFIATEEGPRCPVIYNFKRLDELDKEVGIYRAGTICKVALYYGKMDADWLNQTAMMELPYRQTFKTKGKDAVIPKSLMLYYYPRHRPSRL